MDLIHVAGSGEGQLVGGLLCTRWRETNENISSAFFKYGNLLKVNVKLLLCTPCRHMGREAVQVHYRGWGCRYTRVPAALRQGKGSLIPTEGWTLRPVWTFWRIEKISCPTGNRRPEIPLVPAVRWTKQMAEEIACERCAVCCQCVYHYEWCVEALRKNTGIASHVDWTLAKCWGHTLESISGRVTVAECWCGGVGVTQTVGCWWPVTEVFQLKYTGLKYSCV